MRSPEFSGGGVKSTSVDDLGIYRTRKYWNLLAWFRRLQERLISVDILSGDWSRAVTPTVLTRTAGISGVFLDPPYKTSGDIYGIGGNIAGDVTRWCLEQTDSPHRIVLAAYKDDWPELIAAGWAEYASVANGSGYGHVDHDSREVLYANPACLKKQEAKQMTIF